MSNKHLTQYILNKEGSNVQRLTFGPIMGMPNLPASQKLKAYLSSIASSKELMKEFEDEFEEIAIAIIGIKNKSEKAFNGTNTMNVNELI